MTFNIFTTQRINLPLRLRSKHAKRSRNLGSAQPPSGLNHLPAVHPCGLELSSARFRNVHNFWSDRRRHLFCTRYILVNGPCRVFLPLAGNKRTDSRSKFRALLMHRRTDKQSVLFREWSADKVAVFAKPTPADGTEFVSEASRAMLSIYRPKIWFTSRPQLNKRNRKAVVDFKMRKEGGNFSLLHFLTFYCVWSNIDSTGRQFWDRFKK
jgi:hypothetical protein